MQFISYQSKVLKDPMFHWEILVVYHALRQQRSKIPASQGMT